MNNPSVNFLETNLLSKPLEGEIRTFLKTTPNVFYTSYEIADAINTKPIYKQLATAISTYSDPSFREPATHIGSLCATLNLQGILKRTDKRCPKLKILKAAFAIEI